MPSKTTYLIQIVGGLLVLAGFVLILAKPWAVGCLAAGATLLWGGWILRAKKVL